MCCGTEAEPRPALSQYLPEYVPSLWQEDKQKLRQMSQAEVHSFRGRPIRPLMLSLLQLLLSVCVTPVPHVPQVAVYKKHQSQTTALSGWWAAEAKAGLLA